MAGVISIGISILALIAALFLYRHVGHPLAKYPGPLVAASTDLWQFFTFFSGESHVRLLALHQKYGPVARVGPNSLSFSSLAAYQVIYGFNNAFEKGPFYDGTRDPATEFGSVFSIRRNAQQRVHRRKLGPAFIASKIQSYEPIVSKHVATLLCSISDRAQDDVAQQSSGAEPTPSIINIAYLLHEFVIETSFEIIHGVDVSGQLEDGAAARDLRYSIKFALGIPLLPGLNYLLNSRLGRFLTRSPKYNKDGTPRGLSALDSMSKNTVFSNYIHDPIPSQPSILQSLRGPDSADEKFMTQKQVAADCFNLVGAGQGSTTAALSAILYELGTAKGQEWQHRIRRDACRAANFPSQALNAVIKETLRVHPPFSAAFPRDIASGSENVLIPGIDAPLPAGTTVSCNLFVLSRSKEIWGADAEEWKPERWLDTGVNGSDKEHSGHKALDEQYVVFGKGPRSCIGKEIALKIITQVVKEVLSKWDIVSHGELEGSNYFEMQYESCCLEFAERTTRKSPSPTGYSSHSSAYA